jgi:hypothetical protein
MDEKIKENLIYIRDNIKVDGILDMNDYGCLTGFNRKEVEENKCGTAGCALGWSALLPKFEKEVNNSFNSWVNLITIFLIIKYYLDSLEIIKNVGNFYLVICGRLR